MKFLFFTDTHIRGNTPRNRKDNFYETLKNKFMEIKKISHIYDVDYIIHGGDWFDRPDISPSIVREFGMLIKDFGIPIYSIAGNHDMFGHNPDTINRTMLGILEGIGIIKLLRYEDEIILEKNGLKVQLTGKPYNYDIDGDAFRKYYIVQKRKDVDYAVNIVHGMLLLKPFFEGIQYTLIDAIKETEADITLVGHYHSGFDTVKLDSKYFINPGSLVRVTNTLSEIKRKPKVIIIELLDKISIIEIELESAQPGEDILDRLQLENSQDRNLKLFQFYQGITSVGEYTKVDLNSIISEIASNSSLTQEVKDEAIRRLGIARENNSFGDEE